MVLFEGVGVGVEGRCSSKPSRVRERLCCDWKAVGDACEDKLVVSEVVLWL